MKIKNLQAIFPNPYLQSVLTGTKFRGRDFSRNLLKVPTEEVEPLVTEFLLNIKAQQKTAYKKEAASLLYKFTNYVENTHTVLPASVCSLIDKTAALFDKELTKFARKDLNKKTESFGKYPSFDLSLKDFAKYAQELPLLEKTRTLLEEHSSKDPDLIKKRAHHKKMQDEQEATGKFSAKGDHFEAKYPDSQRMLLMPQPLPKEYDAFCDLLIDKKVALIITLCSPYEGKEVMPYYDLKKMDPAHLSTKGRKIERLSEEVLYEGPEAAPVPKVQKLIEASGEPVDMKSETLKEWRPQIVLYTLRAKNKEDSHELHLLHYKNWPDGQFASDLKAIDVLFQARDRLLQDPNKPLLVHCKAGIGRTGNIALIDWARMRIKEKLAKGEKLDDIQINIPEMFYDLRRFRPKVGSGHKQIAKVYEVLANHYKAIRI